MAKAVPLSGRIYPGWVFKPIPRSATGYVVTIGPHNGTQPDPKPRVHRAAGNGLTFCGINTQVARQGHKTYGLQYVVMDRLPPPRRGKPFELCSKC